MGVLNLAASYTGLCEDKFSKCLSFKQRLVLCPDYSVHIVKVSV